MMLNSIKIKIKKNLFIRQWRKENKHNQTIPNSIFPSEVVKIGRNTYGFLNISFRHILKTGCQLRIGSYVSIADNVTFHLTENHQTRTFTTFPIKSFLNNEQDASDALSKGETIIEDEVWIGYGVSILSGVKIGKGAIIATGAVVVSDIPAYTLAGGVPAKVIRNRFSFEITQRLLNLHLVNLDSKTLKDNIELFYQPIELNGVLDSIESLFKESN